MMKRYASAILLVFFLVSSASPLSAKTILRLGTLVPNGSAWHKIIQRMGAEWQKATNGEVTLRVYAGGVVGDESEMIRKMRIGQLQAAAISNAGLAEIDPRAYAVMLPMMFESYEEWDYVRQKINPILEEKLKESGFIVLAWSDAGWVYFFTNEKMTRPEELKKMKLAASATEPTTVNIFKWAGFNPVPISNVDLITGVQTGLIDAAYMPIMLAEASQFYRQAKNMTDMKWAPLQGAVVMHENGWKRLTPEQQKQVLTIAQDAGEELKRNIREHEERSLNAMKSRGLQVWPVDEEAAAEWRRAAESAYSRIRGKMVPPEIFDEVKRLRDEFQSKTSGSGRP
jgi:TRAP-type C4-dicarboxylate transport system substrate-binding protein